MRILIFSDLHGDYKRAEEIKAIWEEGNFDSIFLLGDILYHGPRNDLPPFYCPKKVIPILSELKDYITAVRGNCDAEVDQMVLPFNILDERKIVEVDGRRILLHHGHHETDTSTVSVVMSGHTHVPVLEEKDGILYRLHHHSKEWLQAILRCLGRGQNFNHRPRRRTHSQGMEIASPHILSHFPPRWIPFLYEAP